MALLDFLFKKQTQITPIETKKDETPYVLSLNFGTSVYPTISEPKNKEYVYFGEDNLYPDELINMFNNCSINQSIICCRKRHITYRQHKTNYNRWNTTRYRWDVVRQFYNGEELVH